MGSRSLSRQILWKALSCQLSFESAPSCRLHPKTHGLSPCKAKRSTFRLQQCRYASHIVESGFKKIEIPDNKLIQEHVWETVDRFPDAVALKCGLTGRKYTFAEVQKLSRRFANSLRKAGYKKGNVLALVLPNCPEFAIITLGALEAEMVVSLINHVYTADEMCHQLKDSGSVIVVAAEDKLDVVLSSISKVEEATKSKPISKVVAVDIPGQRSLPDGVSRYSELVADGVDHSPSSYLTRSRELVFLPYSSGTTGLAKGVCLSHLNIISNIWQFRFSNGASLMRSPDVGQDILLGLLPFYHIYGLVVVLLNSLTAGGQVVTLPKFEQDTFIRTLENEKMSVMMLVPPLILFLGAHPDIRAKHLAHLRLLCSGAAPLGASDLEKAKAKLPSGKNCDIFQAYGMTELSPVVTIPKLPCHNMSTIGPPVPNTVGKIINPESGEALGPNQAGELCFKGPQVMLGYHNNPKATADMIDADGWLRTGDIGYYDEDNNFFIQDRLKELIKVKGFQVPPAELEEVLRTHPLVSDVGVIGRPCPKAGEVPVAYIVPKKDQKLTDEDIKRFLADKVARHKQVADVIFIDSIPKSAAGKILRKDLRKMYQKTFTSSQKQI